jgi:hypothetical protein
VINDSDRDLMHLAAAAGTGSLYQFHFIKGKLKPLSAMFVFFTGLTVGLYGGPFIAKFIPGATKELTWIVTALTALVGKFFIGAFYDVMRKRIPATLESTVDAVVEKFLPRAQSSEPVTSEDATDPGEKLP